MRMSILLGGAPMRRPTRVPDAVIAIERIKPDSFLEIAQLPFGPTQRQRTVFVNDRYPRGIISTVLELSKAVDDQRHNLFISNVTDYSAHKLFLSIYPATCRSEPPLGRMVDFVDHNKYRLLAGGFQHNPLQVIRVFREVGEI